jgi:hypothetical protein
MHRKACGRIGRANVRSRAGENESMFFYEERNQKTSATWRPWPGQRVRENAKVFGFFFSEKKTVLK